MWSGVIKIRPETNILEEHRNTSMQTDNREITEMVWACDEKDRRAHSEKRTDA